MYEMMPYGRDGYSRRYNPFREIEEIERKLFSNPLTFFEKEESFPIKTDIMHCMLPLFPALIKRLNC